jgi:MFS family permease
MRQYLDLLRTPGVAALVAATTLGRLPYGMNVLALILLLRAEGFGYAEVGIVTGAAGLAVGVTAPLLGRVVDRLGQTRVLATTAVLYLSAYTGLAVAALSGAGSRSSPRWRSSAAQAPRRSLPPCFAAAGVVIALSGRRSLAPRLPR